VLAALGILAVTFLAVGAALFEASNRYRTSHHSSRWSQAGQAAEAGADIAFMTLQKNSWTADGWSGVPGSPGVAPVVKTITLTTAVPASSAFVSVDKITMGAAQWVRIRSRGIADISGGTRAGIDTQDILLRKLSFRSDRSTGTSVTTPRATRTCEILAGGKADKPFKRAFLSKGLFDIHTQTMIDSYDSSDPSKSDFSAFGSYGTYALAKRQSNGDIATLDTINTWNLNQARIYGSVQTPTGRVDQSQNVQGTISSGFSTTIPDEVSPNWTVVTQNHGVVSNTSKTITAGTQASPARHKFTSIEYTQTGKKLAINNPAGVSESWVEVWITGETKISDAGGGNGISIAPGVHATIHFGGKVESVGGIVGGVGIENRSKLPSNLIMRAYGGNSGSFADFILKGQDLWGVISAPWYKLKFDRDRHVHGAFISWQVDASDYTNVHYDEALKNLEHGTSSTYQVKSWVEAVR